MKFLRRTLLLLILVNGLLLYTHYIEAGEASTSYQQEIEVMKREDGLYIRQHFTNLSTTRQQIIWPEESTERSCYMQETTSCERMSEDGEGFVEGVETKQSIMYKLPLPQNTSQVQLYENIFAQVADATTAYTQMHITDETGQGGQWLNGLSLVGEEHTQHIDYSYYQGYGDVQALLWQQTALPLTYEDAFLSVYGAEELVNKEQMEASSSLIQEMDLPHQTIIVQANREEIATNRLFTTASLLDNKLIKTIIVQNIQRQYNIEKDDAQIAQLLAALFIEEPVGEPKSVEMYNTLVENLPEEQLTHFIKEIKKQKDTLISPTELDKTLEKVVGYPTSYFAKNREQEGHYPLLFEDSRPLLVNGEEIEGAHLILQDNQILYPASVILQQFDMEMRENEQSIYFEGGSKNYRFPRVEPFYVFNEKKYTVLTTPFEKIAGEYYFDEASFIRIFLMEIEKTEDQIELQLLTFGNEE